MVIRAGVLLVAAVCFTGMWGCVSADVYKLKEQEALTLQRANQAIEGENRSLIDERSELQTREAELKKEKAGLKDLIEKQRAEIAYLQTRASKLERDGDGLRERIEKLNAKIADLSWDNQRLAALTRPENLLRTLGERLADLQKQVEAVSAENQRLKTRQVAVRTEEERTGGVGMAIRPADEKPNASPVWAGQKAEDSTLDKLVQEERKEPTLSEYPNGPGAGL